MFHGTSNSSTDDFIVVVQVLPTLKKEGFSL